MAHDALGAYARDELGISEALGARPFTAALASAAEFPNRCGAAASRDGAGTGQGPDSLGVGHVDRLFGSLGVARQPESVAPAFWWVLAGDLLGCARNGDHRRCGQAVRCRRLMLGSAA